jgi:hypothetical protein
MYREIKLRGSILNKGQLKHLPQEQLYNKVPGVWNLSSDQVCRNLKICTINIFIQNSKRVT